MKVKAMRITGYPVNLEDVEAYQKEWKLGFDEIMDDVGSDMLTVEKRTTALEKELQTKYPTIAEWDFLATLEDWKKKTDEFGNIMVSRHVESKDLIYVIMDEPEQLIDGSQLGIVDQALESFVTKVE